jgi:hypothetical protein
MRLNTVSKNLVHESDNNNPKKLLHVFLTPEDRKIEFILARKENRIE